MTRTVGSYVQSCTRCQQTKEERQLPQGKLQLNEIPSAPWEDISIDLITGLKKVKNYNAILMVVDRFKKMAKIIPCATTTTAADTINLFISHVFSKHGLPQEIVSDRGPQFTSQLWEGILSALKIKPC